MSTRLPYLAAVSFSLVCATGLRAQASLPKELFTPPNTPATATAPAETIEFAGVTTIGKSTDLVFFDKTTKKSRTLTLGGDPVDGIQVLRYDADKQEVVVKINGAQKTLPLRKGTGAVNAPSPVAPMATGFNVASPPVPHAQPASWTGPIPSQSAVAPAPVAEVPAQPAAVPPAGPATPETVAKQEQEARMLVSDLLEIGMAQRKAYEEAQRKAQEAGNNPAAAGQPATTPQPVQTTGTTPPK